MKVSGIVRSFAYSIAGALLVVVLSPSRTAAQDGHMHALTPQAPMNADQQKKAGELVDTVRRVTEPFKDFRAAAGAGYFPLFGCVSGSDFGAMGVHFVNHDLVFDGGELNKYTPEILLYEPTPNGGYRLTGADYIVIAADWDAKHPNDPPQIDGQLFHLFDSPNRFGLPAFYTLHVWAWKDNPNGTFVNWNPNVSCDAFSGQN